MKIFQAVAILLVLGSIEGTFAYSRWWGETIGRVWEAWNRKGVHVKHCRDYETAGLCSSNQPTVCIVGRNNLETRRLCDYCSIKQWFTYKLATCPNDILEELARETGNRYYQHRHNNQRNRNSQQRRERERYRQNEQEKREKFSKEHPGEKYKNWYGYRAQEAKEKNEAEGSVEIFTSSGEIGGSGSGMEGVDITLGPYETQIVANGKSDPRHGVTVDMKFLEVLPSGSDIQIDKISEDKGFLKTLMAILHKLKKFILSY